MKYMFILIALQIVASKASGQKLLPMNVLKSAVNAELNRHNGQFAVAFFDCSTKQSFSINGDTVFHAASTMKTPVMVEVFRQAHEGLFSLTDSVPIKNEFSSIVDGTIYHLNQADDSDSDIYKSIGKKMPIYDLMYRMIINSSNLATNIIIDLIGAKNVMQTMKQFGIRDMKVLRGVEDQKAYDLGMNNVTTANDLMKLFNAIANGKAVSKTASDSMISILKDQRHNDIIPALLPKQVAVAHKTGNISGVQHDSGIIYLPDGKAYIMVLLSKNLSDEAAAVKAMARVSKMIYDNVVQQL